MYVRTVNADSTQLSLLTYLLLPRQHPSRFPKGRISFFFPLPERSHHPPFTCVGLASAMPNQLILLFAEVLQSPLSHAGETHAATQQCRCQHVCS